MQRLRKSSPSAPATHLRFSEKAEQFASLDKVHNHIKVLGILKSAPERNEEWMFDSLEHFSLIVCMLNLLHLDHLLLLQDLDGIITLVVL